MCVGEFTMVLGGGGVFRGIHLHCTAMVISSFLVRSAFPNVNINSLQLGRAK